jgi:hypothetical protein
VAATAVALICVFGALALSVVDARRPFDGRVERSFDATAPSLGGITTVARSRGCTKTSVDFYDCVAEIRQRRGPQSESVYYRLLLQDDGCWNAEVLAPADAISRFGMLHGCVVRD